MKFIIYVLIITTKGNMYTSQHNSFLNCLIAEHDYRVTSSKEEWNNTKSIECIPNKVWTGEVSRKVNRTKRCIRNGKPNCGRFLK